MSAKKNSKGLYYIPLLIILFILFFLVSIIKAQDEKSKELKPGTYEYQWKMKHGDIYFGEPGDKYSVKVN